MCDRCADLELELRVLRAERDLLLEQRAATQAWLGKWIEGSPIDPITQLPDPNIALADRLVEQFPDAKIQAIKVMRNQSKWPRPGTSEHGPGQMLGLKEAKDYIDAAYARADQAKRAADPTHLAYHDRMSMQTNPSWRS